MTCLQRQRVTLTERIIDVSVGSARGWSAVDLIVSQSDRNTHSVTESYVKVHQTTAALQVLSLCPCTIDTTLVSIYNLTPNYIWSF